MFLNEIFILNILTQTKNCHIYVQFIVRIAQITHKTLEFEYTCINSINLIFNRPIVLLGLYFYFNLQNHAHTKIPVIV